MRKGWLYYSIATGIAASLVAFLIIKLTFDMVAIQGQLFNLLYHIGVDAGSLYFKYSVSDSAFILLMAGLLAVEFSAGMLSYLLARDPGDKEDEGLKAPLITGLLPALVFGIYLFNSWQTGLSRQNTNTFAIPTDPAPHGMAIVIILILMMVLMASALAGGMTARYALKRGAIEAGT